MALLTLVNSRSPLADPAAQRATLEAVPLPVSFLTAVARAETTLHTVTPTVLQVNLGKRCNQACHHCHVDAGPDRTEVMSDAVVDTVLGVLEQNAIPTLDITGGAPELHPRFREIVTRAHALGRRVMDRCNLTITTLPNYADLPEFLAEHRVDVVASLPSYAASQTDRQRGEGVFEKSLASLRRFNAVGYGREDTGLVLNLVTNPVGAFLPANQASLERDWKRELKRRYDIEFNRLFTITNMPISRYLEWLEQSGNLETYLTRLTNAFNPATVDGLMCRYTLNVGWDGRLYDCDFNQMLDLPLPQTIFDGLPPERDVITGPHCFGCTAGGGSSCGGATV
jgi:radical SAM/Cys-rich protein